VNVRLGEELVEPHPVRDPSSRVKPDP
jgi:hypothetical protein